MIAGIFVVVSVAFGTTLDTFLLQLSCVFLSDYNNAFLFSSRLHITLNIILLIMSSKRVLCSLRTRCPDKGK